MVEMMTIHQIEMIYNFVYIVLLIGVCAGFSWLHVKVQKKAQLDYWLLTTLLFVGISFVTITLWYVTIGFVV